MLKENKKIKIPIFNDGVSNGDTKSTNYEKIKIKKSNKRITTLKEIQSLKNGRFFSPDADTSGHKIRWGLKK